MSKVKAIIFDCFGVLTSDLWKEFLSTLPPNVDIEALRLLNYQLDKGQISTEDFTSEVQRISGKPVPMLEFLSDDQIKTKNLALIDYIRQLKPTYKIGMLSNISSNWIRESFLTKDEQELFDDMVMSFEVGIAKPSVEIFDLAVKRLDVRPEECVFIDDVNANCLVAQSLGMEAVTYANLQQCIDRVNEIIASKDF